MESINVPIGTGIMFLWLLYCAIINVLNRFTIDVQSNNPTQTLKCIYNIICTYLLSIHIIRIMRVYIIYANLWISTIILYFKYELCLI
jgi:hypothetical protein